MTAYSKTGPFVSGGAPGIDYVFLNNVETFLAYGADSSITTNGSGILTMLGLVVNGNATINGTITTSGGSLNVSSIAVSGNASVTGTLTITGASSLDNANITTDGTGNVTLPNNKSLKMKNSTGTARTVMNVDASNNTNIQAATSGGKIQFLDQTGTVLGYINSTELALTDGQHIKLEDGSFLKTFHHFSGSGNGSFATNIGTTPDGIAFNPCTAGSSSQTIGGTMANTCAVTTGAGFAWDGTAYLHG